MIERHLETLTAACETTHNLATKLFKGYDNAKDTDLINIQQLQIIPPATK